MGLNLKKKVLIFGLLAMSSTLVCFKPVQAITFMEYDPYDENDNFRPNDNPIDNVGHTRSNATRIGSGTEMIWGSLLYENNQRDVDVYRFHWAGGNTNPFEASVQQNWLGTKSTLYLFNVNGYGITKASGNTGITFNDLWSGEYFLAIARNHVTLDSNIQFLYDNGTGSNGNKINFDGAVLGDNSWTDLGHGNRKKNFSYDINISKTYSAKDVPEPTTILGTLFAGGYGLYRKRRQQRSLGK